MQTKPRRCLSHSARPKKHSLPWLRLTTLSCKRVSTTKLLECTSSDQLSWTAQSDSLSLYSKDSLRLYFLCILRRAGVNHKDILQVYISTIRSVLEYACPVWQTCITAEQSDKMDSLQNRALSIIEPANYDIPSRKEMFFIYPHSERGEKGWRRSISRGSWPTRTTN